MSFGVESRVEMGCEEVEESCLLETVVINRRESSAGRRERMLA